MAAQAGSNDGDVDQKPVIEPGVHLTLKVQDLSGRKEKFTLRRTDKLQVLMDAYYARVAPSVGYGTGKFLHEGRRVPAWKTPEELEMEDGDRIDFFTDLMGGGGRQASYGPAW